MTNKSISGTFDSGLYGRWAMRFRNELLPVYGKGLFPMWIVTCAIMGVALIIVGLIIAALLDALVGFSTCFIGSLFLLAGSEKVQRDHKILLLRAKGEVPLPP